jgi:23S rRNA (guanine(745)-N(1))-methyltransferase RlmA-like protein
MRSLRVRHVPIGVSEGIFLSHAEIIAQVERLNRGIGGELALRPSDPLDEDIWRSGATRVACGHRRRPACRGTISIGAPPPTSRYNRSMLLCPVRDCHIALGRAERRLFCPRGHSFDVARSGYINLLQPQERRSKQPGDTVGAVAAQRRLHDLGVTEPLLPIERQSKVATLPTTL